MADLRPFRGLHYSPDLVQLGGVLSPPYDVISPLQQEALYGRNMRNIVRVELGKEYEGDVPGERDRYTRAHEHLQAWLRLGVLVRDSTPALYASSQEFETPAGERATRRGVFGLVPAVPWAGSQLRPHERTLRAPKEDRLALLRATRVQTSPVFAVAAGAAGLLTILTQAASGPGLLGGRMEGEMGAEKHILWRCDKEATLASLQAALSGARLYVADGHHRYETAVAYAEERRRAEPDAPSDADFAYCLVHVVSADDPSLMILPTHRLVRPGPGIAFSLDDLWARLDDAFEIQPEANVAAAVARAAALRSSRHAFTAVAPDGAAVLSRPRRRQGSPRDRLDVTVLEEEVLAPAGLSAEAIAAGGLSYTRDAGSLEPAVRGGDALLAFAVNPVSVEEMIAVADAGETMPQKSTYFYPKVSAGLVLHGL
jgi:uncharacterized protein (DUF1015 family)